MVNIIVGLKDDHKSLKELEKYGEIIHDLDLIHAVAMKVPSDKIPLIKTLRFVHKVEKSRKLTVMHCSDCGSFQDDIFRISDLKKQTLESGQIEVRG